MPALREQRTLIGTAVAGVPAAGGVPDELDRSFLAQDRQPPPYRRIAESSPGREFRSRQCLVPERREQNGAAVRAG